MMLPKITEAMVQGALALHFDWTSNRCFPRVCMWLWEQDFVVITPAMKVWEIEIKTNMADWKADLLKPKWHDPNWKKVSRFYYCVPTALIVDAIPAWVPEHVGVLELKIVVDQGNPKYTIKTRREAKNLSTFKISDKWLVKLMKSTYFRFWRSQKHDPMAATYLQAQETMTCEF